MATGSWNGNLYRDVVIGDVSGTRHGHTLRFHQNMLEECQRLEKPHYQVVLVGDMNIAPARIDGHPNLRTIPLQYFKNRVDFNNKLLCEEERDIDAFRALHNSQRKYIYNPRRGEWGASCDCVDLIVAARILMDAEAPAIVGCDFEDIPEERGHGDHVLLWVSRCEKAEPKEYRGSRRMGLEIPGAWRPQFAW